MKTSRALAVLATLVAMTAAGTAKADGNTVVLNTFSKIWVDGDTRGPDKLGKLTGAGTMDSNFAWDNTSYETDKTKVNLATIYTRSSDTPNNNNSYLQGGVAFGTLTAAGFAPGAMIDLPTLNGDRTFMRPQVAFLPNGRALLIAASEDNGVNNNPQPVAYVVSTAGGAPLKIPNNTRGANNATKPTNLIQQALKDGVNVQNPNDQRGPHTITQVSANTYVLGMQYNNQAQEAFSVTVNDDNSIKMNWLVRYSNTAQHCRPQVQIAPGATTGYIAAVEANNQPAEIGFRVSQFDVKTGKSLQSKIVVKSDPKNNKYVSEPVMGIMGDKLAISYGITAPARKNKNGNGHAGGAMVGAAVIVNQSDLSIVGEPALAVGQYGRHPSSFVTGYGENAEPALAVIGGSSTGTGAGFIQMYTLANGLLDTATAPTKVYQVSPFADVANVQARGKRNPNDQARGFINGLGNVPNPGYTTDPTKAATSFMPETKQFSFSTVTGYSGADAMAKGFKNSIWLSLVPAAWQNGLSTTPGTATATPGTNADGTGPAPRVTGTDPSGGGDAITGDDANAKSRNMNLTNDGCATAPGSSSSNAGLIGLAVVGAIVLGRRKREEA